MPVPTSSLSAFEIVVAGRRVLTVECILEPAFTAVFAVEGTPCVLVVRSCDVLLQRRAKIFNLAVLVVDKDSSGLCHDVGGVCES